MDHYPHPCRQNFQYASKCMQNELCKCFSTEISKKWFLLHTNRLKLTIFLAKMAHFVLSAQNASICIRMHPNVCRMNCAYVLCMKLSKKRFQIHLNRLKLMNYFYHFDVRNPVKWQTELINNLQDTTFHGKNR